MKNLIELYKTKFEDTLSDFNDAQIEVIASRAWDDGHPYGIEESVQYMSDYVDMVRAVIKFK